LRLLVLLAWPCWKLLLLLLPPPPPPLLPLLRYQFELSDRIVWQC